MVRTPDLEPSLSSSRLELLKAFNGSDRVGHRGTLKQLMANPTDK